MHLDEAVHAALAQLRASGAPPPVALLLLGTGLGELGHALEDERVLELDGEGTPACWRGAPLLTGTLAGGPPVWLLEDAPLGTAESLAESPPWARAFPCWLAAASGALVCVVTSAGRALPEAPGAPSPGELALARDHLNLSGASPLVGLGESVFGPLFPDQTRLHHATLRAAALLHAREIGQAAREVVVACTAGPALDTPAEARFLARAGAEVVVQELAGPLLACAHAGLAVLSITAVTDAAQGAVDVAAQARLAEAMAPRLEDLLAALAPDLSRAALALAAEGHAR